MSERAGVREGERASSGALTPSLPHSLTPSPLEYVRQSAADLVYSLFGCAAPRHLVKVLAERRVRMGGFEVSLAIIGSSHFLEFRSGAGAATEMLAASRPGLEGLPTIGDASCTTARLDCTLQGGADYRFEMQPLVLTPEAFERESGRMSLPASDRLCFKFPASDEAIEPLTCVEWEMNGLRLAVRTYHTFPGELTIVQSRSMVEFPEEGRTP